MTVLRGALVGCGFFAQFHVDSWRRMDGVELVAACDLDLARAAAVAPRAYTNMEDLLAAEKLDFVDIATRPETHLSLVEQAAAAGLAIICQKPMAPSLADARQMVEIANRAGARLMIHENWRWQPWYREVQRRLAAGDIGEPVTYRFRIRKRDGSGDTPYAAQPYFRQMPRLLIYETLIHALDTARFLFGDIDAVAALTRRLNPVIAGEDFAQILVTHQAGIAGIVDGHRFTDLAPDSPPLGDAEFEGQAGVLSVAASGDVYRNGRLVWRNTVSQGYRGDSVHATQSHFIQCLRTGDCFETGAAGYLYSYAAAEAAYRSAQEARVVKVREFFV